MNDPNDPYPPGGSQSAYPPQQGYPAHPGAGEHGSPAYPPPHPPYPPYPPPRRGNAGLLIGIFAGIGLLIAGGLTLYFTGAFGGRPDRSYLAEALPAINANDIVGTWDRSSSRTLDGIPCQRPDRYIAIFAPDGRRGDGSVGMSANQVALDGSYRVEGKMLVELSSGGTERRQLVYGVTPNSFQVSDVDFYEEYGPGGGYHYFRCGGSGGAVPATASAPGGTYAQGSEPSASGNSTTVDQAFITGRWCDDGGMSVTFTPTGSSPTGGIARMESGGRIRSTESYDLVGGAIRISGNNGASVLPLTRIDANTMTIKPTSRAAETMRRC